MMGYENVEGAGRTKTGVNAVFEWMDEGVVMDGRGRERDGAHEG
jgi:hypothetical protein